MMRSKVLLKRDGGNSVDPARPDLRVLDGIASWCGGLHGSMPFSDALRSLANAFNAEAAVISRHMERPRSKNTARDCQNVIALYDAKSGADDNAMICRPFCQDVMGYLFVKARASTVWFMSDHLDDPNWATTQTLENWRATRDITEIVVLALAGNLQQQDYLEFHFARTPAYSERLEFERLVPTLVRAWAGRKSGLVTQAKVDGRIARARAAAHSDRTATDAAILGVSNPARLSRAEFRVCLLISRGLSVSGITEELGLTEATVRSHLRSIYSKTGVSGLPELLYRILSAENEVAERSFATR